MRRYLLRPIFATVLAFLAAGIGTGFVFGFWCFVSDRSGQSDEGTLSLAEDIDANGSERRKHASEASSDDRTKGRSRRGKAAGVLGGGDQQTSSRAEDRDGGDSAHDGDHAPKRGSAHSDDATPEPVGRASFPARHVYDRPGYGRPHWLVEVQNPEHFWSDVDGDLERLSKVLGLPFIADNQAAELSDATKELMRVETTAMVLLAFQASGQTFEVGNNSRQHRAATRQLLMRTEPDGSFFPFPEGATATHHHLQAQLLALWAISDVLVMSNKLLFVNVLWDGWLWVAEHLNSARMIVYGPERSQSDPLLTALAIQVFETMDDHFTNLSPELIAKSESYLKQVPDEAKRAQWRTQLATSLDSATNALIAKASLYSSADYLVAAMDATSNRRIDPAWLRTWLTKDSIPRVSDNPDLLGWYLRSDLYRVLINSYGKESWATDARAWSKALRDELYAQQRGWRQDDITNFGFQLTDWHHEERHPRLRLMEAGSWDPIGPWGASHGRIMTTALAEMALESADTIERSSE